MSLSKKVRAELRRRCPTPEETDALLDAHDERDRYRALLEDIKIIEGDALLQGTVDDIDAALEGKNND